MAAAVEKTSQLVMSTVNAITASGEGAGLSKVDAFKTAMEAVVSVVASVSLKLMLKVKKVDFSDSNVLEDIQQKATEVAIIKGADEKTFDIALDQAID